MKLTNRLGAALFSRLVACSDVSPYVDTHVYNTTFYFKKMNVTQRLETKSQGSAATVNALDAYRCDSGGCAKERSCSQWDAETHESGCFPRAFGGDSPQSQDTPSVLRMYLRYIRRSRGKGGNRARSPRTMGRQWWISLNSGNCVLGENTLLVATLMVCQNTPLCCGCAERTCESSFVITRRDRVGSIFSERRERDT